LLDLVPGQGIRSGVTSNFVSFLYKTARGIPCLHCRGGSYASGQD